MPSLNTKLASAPNTQTNYVLKATSSTTIGNSTIQDTGSLVTVTSPTDIVTGSGIGSSGVTGLLRVVTAGTSTGIAIGQANSSRYTAIQPNEHIIYNDDFFMRTNGAFPLSLGTNNTIRMSITSAGNVGIGTSSPSFPLQVNATNGAVRLSLQNSDNTGYLAFTEQEIKMWRPDGSGASLNIATQAISGTFGGHITFSPLNTERMRITGAGKVCINTTSSNNGWLSVQGAYGAAAIDARGAAGEWTYYGIASSTSGSSNGLLLYAGTTSADVSVLIKNQSGSSDYFQIRGDGLILSPSTYNVTTATAANLNIGTAGDFRRSTSSIKYKTDVINYDKGLAEVMQMRPVYYKGINDGDTQFAGLIAEEVHDLGLTEFVQYAEDGTPDALAYQNMIALLTKAIQEQQAQIEELKALINK